MLAAIDCSEFLHSTAVETISLQISKSSHIWGGLFQSKNLCCRFFFFLGGGSKAVWNFSENSCNLVAGPFPKILTNDLIFTVLYFSAYRVDEI